MGYITMDMDSAKWYYLWAGQQQGPMNAKALQGLLKSGTLPPSTLVWTATQPDWRPANSTTTFFRHKSKGATCWRKVAGILLLFVCLGIGGQYFLHSYDQTLEPTPQIFGKTVSNASPLMAEVDLSIQETAETQINHYKTIGQYQTLVNSHIRIKTDYELLQSNIENERTRNELDAYTLIELQKENEKLSLQNTDLRQQLHQKKSHPDETQVRILEKDITKTNIESKTTKRHIHSSNNTPLKYRPNPALPKCSDTSNSLLGYISNVDHKFGRVVITAGSKSGISVGEKFRIRSRMGGENLGQLSIQQTLPLMSIAVFEGEDINSLKLGDHILR
jgi:hypothetical protein